MSSSRGNCYKTPDRIIELFGNFGFRMQTKFANFLEKTHSADRFPAILEHPAAPLLFTYVE